LSENDIPLVSLDSDDNTSSGKTDTKTSAKNNKKTTDLSEDEVPLSDSPDTGDSTQILLAEIIVALALIAIVGMLIYYRKKIK
jgi:LPXTG-motif cell wall-anchored protein